MRLRVAQAEDCAGELTWFLRSRIGSDANQRGANVNG